jgi:hypothetical protein
MSLPGPGAAFCQRRSGVSIRLLKGAFSFLSARLHAPCNGALKDLLVGDS